jgi:hypothetical protein
MAALKENVKYFIDEPTVKGVKEYVQSISVITENTGRLLFCSCQEQDIRTLSTAARCCHKYQQVSPLSSEHGLNIPCKTVLDSIFYN